MGPCDKTLNQRISETPADVKKAIYDSGYEAGITCGKLCAAQQILDELEEALTNKREEYRQKREANKDIPEYFSYWLARGLTCGEVLPLLTKLKKKYEIS